MVRDMNIVKLSTDNETNVRLKCPIKNNFHKTTGGCYIVVDKDGRRTHVYKQIAITLDVHCRPLFRMCHFNWDYDFEYFSDSELVKFITDYPAHAKSFDDIVKSHTACEAFWRNTLEFYHTFRKKLVTCDKVQYEMYPKTIYDVLQNETHINFMRPSFLIDDQTVFIQGQRQAYFTMLQAYSETEECKTILKTIHTKDKQICSCVIFAGKARTVPPELKCNYMYKDACPHIAENSENGKTILKIPTTLCQFLLEAMIDDYNEGSVNELFQFKCRYVRKDHEHEEPPMILVHKILFGRNSNIHRMCLPDRYIGPSFYEWYLRKVINIPPEIEL